MTSRLKHKLEIENINTKSKYLNESFVQIGTPLPALAENKKDKLEYVPEWNQEVRDEQGRRRFHGAFTGGFSAGYYNTVGSKEGWAPSTFKSSRTNRANKSQRVEDFMDEEDLASMREDRTLSNTETFKSDRLGSTQAELEARGPTANTLDSLIAPARSSVGEKLLQKQGWRPGQGIGPRMSLQRLKRQEAKLVKNGVMTSKGEDEEGDMELDGGNGEATKHTFAPRDVKLLVFAAKEDQQGLGYIPGMGGGISRAPAPQLRANHVQVDEDEDFYGGYEGGPSRSNRHYAFDDLEDEAVTIGAIAKAGPSGSGSRSAISVSSDIDTSRYHDGRPVLPGFELDPLGAPTDKWFALPEIPADWRPRPARVWGTTRKWDQEPGQAVDPSPAAIRGAPGQPLSIHQRGNALGESRPPPAQQPAAPATSANATPLTSTAKSVFEFMSEKDRDRLQSFIAASKAANAASSTSQAGVPDTTAAAAFMADTPTEVVIPPLSPRTAGAALRGFVPYGDDPAKQDRYRSYVSSQVHNSTAPQPVLRKGTVEEINNELADFASSARIFKPMSFAMSSRFTSGSASLAVSDMKQAKAGLHIYDAEKAAAASEEEKKRVEAVGGAEGGGGSSKPLTPREQAAKDGRYGPLTRTEKAWYPAKLLCRRFGVKDPHPEGEPKGIEIDTGAGSGGMAGLEGMPLPRNDASWESAFTHQAGPSHATPSADEGNDENEAERLPKTLAEVGMPGDANQGRDTLTYTKPSIDIFKAIFASDDESDDEDDDDAAGGNAKGRAAADDNVPASVLIERQNAKRAADRKRKLEEEREKAMRQEGPVDLATFKPVFQRRVARADDTDAADPEKQGGSASADAEGATGDASKKKKRKKDKRKGVLSFHVDEAEDGGEWVEKKVKIKPVAATAAALEPSEPEAGTGVVTVDSGSRNAAVLPSASATRSDSSAVKPPAGRKSAADFM